MRFFFKHLARSVRLKPLQPLLLVLILALAVATSIFALSLDYLLQNEIERTQFERYGSAHITVTLDGSSESRFMFVRDAQEILGETAEVAGLLELPLSYGDRERAVAGVATDFSEIGRIFDFSFIEYGVLTPSVIAHSAFISSAFAQENSLAVGDRFEVCAFGSAKQYTVVGISALPLIEAYDVMVDSSGIASFLAGDSLLLSSLKGDFRPCSTLYVEVLGAEEAQRACAELLSDAPAFQNATVSTVSDLIASRNNTDSLSTLIDIAILLACILAAAVSFACLYILSTERAEENRSFMLSGARASHVHAVQYAEVLLYWMVGSVFGVLSGCSLVRRFVSSFDFRYVSSEVRAIDLFKSVLFVLCVAMLTVAMFTLSEPMMRRERAPKNIQKVWLVIPVFVAVLVLPVSFVIPAYRRAFLSIPVVVVLVLFVFFCVPSLFCWITRRIDHRLSQKTEKTNKASCLAFRYAIKNILSVKILHNTARLFAVLFFAVVSVAILMMSAVGHICAAEQSLCTDMIVFGATNKCYRGITECESVESCYRVYMQNLEIRDVSVLAFGAEDMCVFNEGLRPSVKPAGNSIAISSGEAEYYAVEVGDLLTLEIAGESIEVVVGEILQTSINAILIDNEHFGLHYNLLFVNKTEAATEAELLAQMSEHTATELATFMRTQLFWDEILGTLEVYLGAGIILLVIVCMFALVALLDNLGQSYRMRREEFALYRISGMTRKDVFAMKIWEVALSLSFGALVASIAVTVFFYESNSIFYSFAYDNLLGLEGFFKA